MNQGTVPAGQTATATGHPRPGWLNDPKLGPPRPVENWIEAKNIYQATMHDVLVPIVYDTIHSVYKVKRGQLLSGPFSHLFNSPLRMFTIFKGN